MKKSGLILISMIFLVLANVSAKENFSALKDGQFIIQEKDGRLTIEARQADLGAILQEFQKITGIEVELIGRTNNEKITLKIAGASRVEALKKMLRNNYVLIFRNDQLEKSNFVGKGEKNNEDFSGQIEVSGETAKIFFAPTDFSPAGIDEYISKRHALLEKLAEEKPDLELDGQISLDEFISADDLKEFLAKNPGLVPTALSPGWKDHVGGFEINGEDINYALLKLEEKEGEFISLACKNAKEAFDSAPEAEKAEAESYLNEWLERKKFFEEKGVTLFGLKVSGRAKDLNEAKNQNGARLVDPIYGGDALAGFDSAYQANAIAIPLSPYTSPKIQGEEK